jgi:hypothetical protein
MSVRPNSCSWCPSCLITVADQRVVETRGDNKVVLGLTERVAAEKSSDDSQPALVSGATQGRDPVLCENSAEAGSLDNRRTRRNRRLVARKVQLGDA